MKYSLEMISSFDVSNGRLGRIRHTFIAPDYEMFALEALLEDLSDDELRRFVSDPSNQSVLERYQMQQIRCAGRWGAGLLLFTLFSFAMGIALA